MTFPVLQDKVAIVTGAAMGMGEATARLFAEAGAKVIVADFNVEAGEKVVADITAAGGTATFVAVDISDEAQVEEMVKAAVSTYGRLDVAVNNAALKPDQAPSAELDPAYWDRLMSVDLKGTALCQKHELKQFLAQGEGGSIVNIASVSGFRPQPGNPAYTAAKHGVVGLTKVAALEYGSLGVRVNAVAPGAVQTPMLDAALEEIGADRDEFAKQLSSLGRFADAREIAQATLWLSSDAASYVHGTTLKVDGGFTGM
ncbi:glucose 1-dehydrogenase [Brevibacterium samyangense]|uniref:SDR family oxidoreductase n=1 Tax=Brevibacterium samyangense TaxID=366888 RepID=A0ABN2T754_9MICO